MPRPALPEVLSSDTSNVAPRPAGLVPSTDDPPEARAPFDTGDAATPLLSKVEPGSYSTPIAEASVVPYTPAAPSKWSPVPSSVAKALDGLAASGGGGSGAVTSVTASSPLSSSGGTTPNLTIAVAGQTEGDLLYFNGTAWVRLPAGTAGQVLTTEGSAAAPQWLSPAAVAQENNPVDLNPHEIANIDPLLAAGVGIQPPALVYLTEPFTNSSGTALSGTFTPTNNSTSVGTSISQVGLLSSGSSIAFASQPGVFYPVASVTATTITLQIAYLGPTPGSPTTAGVAAWIEVTEGTPAPATVASSEFTFSEAGNGTSQWNNLMLEGQTLGMPQACVTIHIAAASNSGGASTYEDYSVGIAKDANNYVYASWRRNSGYVRLHVKIAGASNDSIGQVTVAWTPPFDLGFSLVGVQATIWYRPSGGTWTVISTSNIESYYDFRANGSIVANTWQGSWAAAYFPANGSTVSVSFANFNVGAFGGSGIRDTCVVSSLSGAPILAGTQVWLTATLTDPGASAYCGVMTYDLVARTLTQVGVIMIDRVTAAGTAPSVSITLSGTFTTAASAVVTTQNSQVGVLFPGSVVAFAAQPTATYVVLSVASGSITLTTPYTGTTGATTAQLGVVQNDNAAHIIEDGTGGYHFFISSWGNTEVGSGGPYIDIMYKHETVLNLLSGMNVVSLMATPILPGTSGSVGSYDPYCIYDAPASTYYLAYTLAPNTSNSFYPALASSATGFAGPWSSVGSDPASTSYEGSRMISLAGQYWALWATDSQARVYDLTMTYQGVYDNLVVASGYAPHPMLVALGNYVYEVTFDDEEYNSNAANIGHLRSFRSWRYSVLP